MAQPADWTQELRGLREAVRLLDGRLAELLDNVERKVPVTAHGAETNEMDELGEY